MDNQFVSGLNQVYGAIDHELIAGDSTNLGKTKEAPPENVDMTKE